MGCCASREREQSESIPAVDEETEVPAEVAQNLKDVPEEGSYPTSSDEDQTVVPHDRRPRFSLIPFVSDVNNDAARASRRTSPALPQDMLTSINILDAHLGIQQTDSISTDRRPTQWDAVALSIAVKRGSQDASNVSQYIRRVSWSPTAGSPNRKRRAMEEQDKMVTPHGNECLADIRSCSTTADSPHKPLEPSSGT